MDSMTEYDQAQQGFGGCLLRVVVWLVGISAFMIFILGVLAGIVIASTL